MMCPIRYLLVLRIQRIIYIYMYVGMYVCMYVCMYVYLQLLTEVKCLESIQAYESL